MITIKRANEEDTLELFYSGKYRKMKLLITIAFLIIKYYSYFFLKKCPLFFFLNTYYTRNIILVQIKKMREGASGINVSSLAQLVVSSRNLITSISENK